MRGSQSQVPPVELLEDWLSLLRSRQAGGEILADSMGHASAGQVQLQATQVTQLFPSEMEPPEPLAPVGPCGQGEGVHPSKV